MLVNERSLLVRVTLDTCSIGAGSESGLFEFKTAMRVMAIAALHRAFEHFVMKRQHELMFCFTMAAQTELRFTLDQ